MRKFLIFLSIIMVLMYFTTSSTKEVPVEVETHINIEIVAEEGIEIEPFKEALAKVPGDIIKGFVDNNWSLFIVKDLEKGGSINYEKKRITVNAVPYQEDMNLIHEMGHYLDYSLNFISGNEEFLELYESNKDYIEYIYRNVSDIVEEEELRYCVSNEREFFASVFKDYILYNSYVKTNYADLYAFMECILK